MNFPNKTYQLEELKCLVLKWQRNRSVPNFPALILAICVFITSIFSVSGNGLVIFTIYRSRSLHSPSNVLIAGLALSDFGIGFITQFSYLAEYMAAVRGNVCASNFAYIVYRTSAWILTMLSLLTLTFIAVERYCAVVFHLRYNEIITVKRTKAVLLTAWIILPALTCMVAVTGTPRSSVVLVHGIAIFIGIFITCLCYLKVFLVVRRHLSQINIQLQASGYAIHDAARLKKKFFTVLFVVVAFVVCYLPFSLSIITSRNKRGRAMTLTILLGGSSCIHSVIYFWRIKVLRQAAKGQIFKVCKCCSYCSD